MLNETIKLEEKKEIGRAPDPSSNLRELSKCRKGGEQNIV